MAERGVCDEGRRAADPRQSLSASAQPPQGESRKPAKRQLTDAEVTRLIDAAPKSWQTMLRVAAITGLRLSELLGLVWDDVDFASEELHVRAQLSVATTSSPAWRVKSKSKNSVRTLPLLTRRGRWPS